MKMNHQTQQQSGDKRQLLRNSLNLIFLLFFILIFSSATGHGEFFIRNSVAFDVSARMEYLGMPLEEATKTIIMEKLPSQGGTGGLIAIDKDGNISMPFNTTMMYRGYLKASGEIEVMAY